MHFPYCLCFRILFQTRLCRLYILPVLELFWRIFCANLHFIIKLLENIFVQFRMNTQEEDAAVTISIEVTQISISFKFENRDCKIL